MSSELPDDDAKVKMRAKINEFMLRAEYLKERMAKKSIKNQPQTGRAKERSNSGRQRAIFTKQHTQHAHAILDEVLDKSPGVHWTDIAGLKVAKQILQEAVILPTLRPDLFTGLRAPPRGVLLFGPPGTGKTLLAKAVATEAKATFFNISASTLTSKWVGEGEKLVRALFEMARELQPSVVFMDEVDALLSTRSASENDASRRIKNQFFTELDGAASSQEDRILVMGATNLPQELDEAIIRRLEKRIYVPLPDATSREGLIKHLLSSQKCSLSAKDFQHIVKATNGYSGSDLKAVCKDAALGPIRDLGAVIANVKAEDVRRINASDFQVALTRVRPSVSLKKIEDLIAWNERFGVSAV